MNFSHFEILLISTISVSSKYIIRRILPILAINTGKFLHISANAMRTNRILSNFAPGENSNNSRFSCKGNPTDFRQRHENPSDSRKVRPENSIQFSKVFRREVVRCVKYSIPPYWKLDDSWQVCYSRSRQQAMKY